MKRGERGRRWRFFNGNEFWLGHAGPAIGPAVIIRGADLTVASGRVCGLLGRNGAGKTTLLRAMMGLLPARAGVHFPMSEDEMRWHLGYFDVAS